MVFPPFQNIICYNFPIPVAAPETTTWLIMVSNMIIFRRRVVSTSSPSRHSWASSPPPQNTSGSSAPPSPMGKHTSPTLPIQIDVNLISDIFSFHTSNQCVCFSTNWNATGSTYFLLSNLLQLFKSYLQGAASRLLSPPLSHLLHLLTCHRWQQNSMHLPNMARFYSCMYMIHLCRCDTTRCHGATL